MENRARKGDKENPPPSKTFKIVEDVGGRAEKTCSKLCFIKFAQVEETYHTSALNLCTQNRRMACSP